MFDHCPYHVTLIMRNFWNKFRLWAVLLQGNSSSPRTVTTFLLQMSKCRRKKFANGEYAKSVVTQLMCWSRNECISAGMEKVQKNVHRGFQRLKLFEKGIIWGKNLLTWILLNKIRSSHYEWKITYCSIATISFWF